MVQHQIRASELGTAEQRKPAQGESRNRAESRWRLRVCGPLRHEVRRLRRANPARGSKKPCCKIPAPAELELEPAASLAAALICFATGEGRFRAGSTAGLIGAVALRQVPTSNSWMARATLEDGRGGTMPAGSRAGGGGGGGGGASAMGLLGFFGQLMGRERRGGSLGGDSSE